MSLEYGMNSELPTNKWYFDMQSRICYPFEYTGGGPKISNRFKNFNDCSSFCAEKPTNNTDETSLTTSRIEFKHSVGKFEKKYKF